MAPAQVVSQSVRREDPAMRRIKTIRDVPLFPLIPLLPAAILIGSLATAVNALVRVRRLEQRLPASA
jgi:hypothetical protein